MRQLTMLTMVCNTSTTLAMTRTLFRTSAFKIILFSDSCGTMWTIHIFLLLYCKTITFFLNTPERNSPLLAEMLHSPGTLETA